jgi:two-component system sensor histidine kinase ChiS
VREKKTILQPTFNQAIEAYYQQQFQHACQLFEHILQQLPIDKAASFYLERCEYYIKQGTPADWEGIEALAQK